MECADVLNYVPFETLAIEEIKINQTSKLK